ncbi:MAG TPA: SRPBCC domain-containing protein [Allosphingosinicella sp.]
MRVTRRFSASAETVFDAWLLEQGVGGWLFATPEGEMVRAEIEPHVGGRFEIVERRDGEEVLHTGNYEEMARPLRLAFSLQVPKYSPNPERVAIEIAPDSDGCELTLSQTLSAGAPATAEQVERGWRAILDALAEAVERSGPGS